MHLELPPIYYTDHDQYRSTNNHEEDEEDGVSRLREASRLVSQDTREAGRKQTDRETGSSHTHAPRHGESYG